MKSWKTTLLGIILGGSMGIASGQVPGTEGAQGFAKLAASISAVLLGLFSKDKNVTGGTTRQ